MLSGRYGMCDRGWVFEIWMRPKGVLVEPFLVIFTSSEFSRAKNIALRGTDQESYITEYALVYEEKRTGLLRCCPVGTEKPGKCGRS